MVNATLSSFLEQIESALKAAPKGAQSQDQKQGIIESYKDGVIAIKGLSSNDE